MSELEICPVCQQEKKCAQIFIDGIKNHIRYACKECQYAELVKVYDKETADMVLGFINKMEKAQKVSDEK